MIRRDNARGFGRLDGAQIARLDAVVAKARDSMAEAQSLVPGVLSNTWASIIGADSTAAALRSNAHSAEVLYNTVKTKRDRLVTDPNASEWDVLEMEGATYAFGNEASRQASYQLSSGAFYDQVIAQTGRDILNPFGVPLWVWGAGILVGWVALNSRRR